MKKILMALITSGAFSIGAFDNASAQQQQNDKIFIGTTTQLVNHWIAKNSNANANAKTAYDDLTIAVDQKTILTIVTNAKKQKENAISFIGNVKSIINSSFFLSINGTHADGKIILKEEK